MHSRRSLLASVEPPGLTVASSSTAARCSSLPEAAKPPTRIDRTTQPHEFSTLEPSGASRAHGRELDAGQTSYDQHGRTTPRCDRHLTSTTDDPCRACGDARVEYQAAQKARDEDLARARVVEARRQWAQEAGDAPKPPDFWQRASAS